MPYDALNRLSLHVPKENRIAPSTVSFARDCAVAALVLGPDAMGWQYGWWGKKKIVTGKRTVISTVVGSEGKTEVDATCFRWVWDERIAIELRVGRQSWSTGRFEEDAKPGLPMSMDNKALRRFSLERIAHYTARIADVRAALSTWTGCDELHERGQLEDGLRTMPEHWARAAYAMLNEPSMWLTGVSLALFAKEAS